MIPARRYARCDEITEKRGVSEYSGGYDDERQLFACSRRARGAIDFSRRPRGLPLLGGCDAIFDDKDGGIAHPQTMKASQCGETRILEVEGRA